MAKHEAMLVIGAGGTAVAVECRCGHWEYMSSSTLDVKLDIARMVESFEMHKQNRRAGRFGDDDAGERFGEEG